MLLLTPYIRLGHFLGALLIRVLVIETSKDFPGGVRMQPNTIFPQELLDEIESYAKVKGITVREFILWAVGEKIGELRQRLGQKNLTSLNLPLQQNDITSDKGIKQLPIVPPLLKAAELSKLLQISKSCAYRLMKTGEIPTIRIGKSVRVRKEDLEGFIDNSRNVTE